VQEAVSAVLEDRAPIAEGLNRMLTVSIAVHVALLAGVWLMPADWRSSRVDPDQSAMVIQLGGAEGPDVGGMTSIADRAVQAIAKPDAPKAIETPPAPKLPEMVEPDRVAKVPPKPTKPVNKPDETSKTRTPTTGAEIKTGSARVKTGGAAIPFGGLASQSGGGGDGVRLDVQNFCCPQYIVQMRQLIHRNWDSNQGAIGSPVVKFTIRRDGVLTQIELEQSSGQQLLDIAARRAVINTRQLPPLPREFTGEHLTVHLTFEFKR
jgi:periplasmic protein TonB